MATPKETKEAVGFPGDDDYQEGNWEDVDALLGALTKSWSWDQAPVGAAISGVIESAAVGVQTDVDGTVKVFDDGTVRKQVVITLATDEVDPEDPDDDGLRRLFVKGAMVRSFRSEMRRNKVPGVRPGGRLTVTFTGEEPPTKKGYSPTKLFEVAYEPPGS